MIITNMNANNKNIISVNKLKKDLTDLMEVLISSSLLPRELLTMLIMAMKIRAGLLEAV